MNRSVDKATGDAVGGDCNVDWVMPDEWLEYEVWAPQGQQFFLLARLASAYQNKKLLIEVDGVPQGRLTAPSYGWQDHADRTIPIGQLSAGMHSIRVVFETGDVNLNYLDVLSQPPTMPWGQADFMAHECLRLSDSTPENIGAASSPECDAGNAVELQTSTGGGCNIGWTTAGEWVEWDVWQEGTSAHRAVMAMLASEFDDEEVRIDVDGVHRGVLEAPANGWQAYEHLQVDGGLFEPGSHTVRVVFLTGNVNLKDVYINTLH